MATVVVLGGSFGGLTTAYELQRHLKAAGAERRHNVCLVADRPTFTYRPALPWLIFGQRTPAGVSFDLAEACKKRGLSFIHGHVSDIDLARKSVRVGAGHLFYDHLVLAPGADRLADRTPGLAAHTHNPLWLDDALDLRQAIRHFRGGPAVIGTAGPSPWTCPAYELLWFLVDRLDRRGRLGDATLQFVTAEPTFMFSVGPEKSKALAERAASRGVRVHAGVEVKLVEDGTVELSDGQRLPSELTVLLPRMRPAPVVAALNRLERNDEGFLEVGLDMRVERRDQHDGLWAVGDIVGFAGYKSGRVAELQGRVAAWNVARELGVVRGRPRRYISEHLCIVRHGPGLASFVWERPAPRQGRPKRLVASAVGRWPYFAKMALEKTWLARHR